MEERFPVKKITDVYHFEKYNPKASTALHVWSWIQLLTILILISYFFGNLASIGTPMIFYYGGFIFLCVYALTELMDRNLYAIVWEAMKNIIGYYLLIKTGNWFGAGQHIAGVNYLLIGYFLLSFSMTFYFVLRHYREDHGTVPVTAH